MTKEHCGTKYREYTDMFKYIEKKCNFHDEKGQTIWTCHGDLSFTEAWCKRNKMDFERVKHIMNFFGGFCDCEILFNVYTERYDNIWKDNLMILERLKE